MTVDLIPKPVRLRSKGKGSKLFKKLNNEYRILNKEYRSNFNLITCNYFFYEKKCLFCFLTSKFPIQLHYINKEIQTVLVRYSLFDIRFITH